MLAFVVETVMSINCHSQMVWLPYLAYDHIPSKSSAGHKNNGTHTMEFTSSHSPAERCSATQQIAAIANTGISFERDVLSERCLHLLPYSISLTQTALSSYSHSRTRVTRVRKPEGVQMKKAPPKYSYLKPQRVQPTKMLPDLSVSIPARVVSPERKDVEKADMNDDSRQMAQENAEWDDYLLRVLSADTARWIVQRPTTDREAQVKLNKKLDAIHGPVGDDYKAELVSDDVSDAKDNQGSQPMPVAPKQSWIRPKDRLVECVRQLTGIGEADGFDSGLHSSTEASRLSKQNQQSEESGAINKTAEAIIVEPRDIAKRVPLKGSLSSRSGDKPDERNNRFQQDWLSGSKHVYEHDKNLIRMDSSAVYQKKVRRRTPCKPESWLRNDDSSTTATDNRVVKGHFRWTALPELVEESDLKCESVVDASDEDRSLLSPCNKQDTLVEIMNDWRALWQLEMRFDEITTDGLIRDMADAQVDVRLRAIITCSKARENKSSPSRNTPRTSDEKLLSEPLYTALECCLDDNSERVRRAAAITLFVHNRPVEKAELVLRKILADVNNADHWTAVRCLAFYGECNQQIVNAFIRQLMSDADVTRQRQATEHLIELSKYSTLVHAMLGERLNSGSWYERFNACKMLCNLQGHYSKDLVNKLVFLMWNDWHGKVRDMALTALITTGHGLDVHNSLLKVLETETDKTKKANTVIKIGQLGIMTAKLLDEFLRCFGDEHSTVRIATCDACRQLHIQHDGILAKLIELVRDDPVDKVKVSAIRALGAIGVKTSAIHQALLWSFRFENDETVRAEACRALHMLHIDESDVIILQERHLIETSEPVQREIRAALAKLGVSPTDDMPMVVQIKKSVQQLCEPNIVREKLMKSEMRKARNDALEHFIVRPNEGQHASASPHSAPVAFGRRISQESSRSKNSSHTGLANPLLTDQRTSSGSISGVELAVVDSNNGANEGVSFDINCKIHSNDIDTVQQVQSTDSQSSGDEAFREVSAHPSNQNSERNAISAEAPGSSTLHSDSKAEKCGVMEVLALPASDNVDQRDTPSSTPSTGETNSRINIDDENSECGNADGVKNMTYNSASVVISNEQAVVRQLSFVSDDNSVVF